MVKENAKVTSERSVQAAPRAGLPNRGRAALRRSQLQREIKVKFWSLKSVLASDV